MKKIIKVVAFILALVMLSACAQSQSSSNKPVLFEGVRPGQTVPDVLKRFENNKAYTFEDREFTYDSTQTTQHVVRISKPNNKMFDVFGNDAPFFNFSYDPVKERVISVNATLQVSDVYGAELTSIANTTLDNISKVATLSDTDKQEASETYTYSIKLEDRPYNLRVSIRWGDKALGTTSNILISLNEAE